MGGPRREEAQGAYQGTIVVKRAGLTHAWENPLGGCDPIVGRSLVSWVSLLARRASVARYRAHVWPDLSMLDPSVVPDLLRGVVGLIGGIALVAGGRLYKAALAGLSFCVGGMGAWAALQALQLPFHGPAPWIAIGVAGLVAVGVAAAVHRLALIGVGAVVGGIAGVALASALLLPMWAPLVGAGIGAVLLPWLSPVIVRLASAGVGAMLVSWALGWPGNALVVGALWAFGASVQLLSGRSAKDNAQEERR